VPALEFERASVGYRDAAVLAEIDLALPRGEVLGVIGPNGAGKTTLLRAVTGEARVMAGRVLVADRAREVYGARDLARVVAVVPQQPPVAFAFTARRFVEMGRHPYVGRLRGLGPEDREAVERAMAMTDTARLEEERVDTLSGGDLQRLTLAQALAQQPDVLLLDEPTSHLDLSHTLQILDVVRELADGGVAVLGVFHDLSLAARYSDRLAVIAGGRLRACGKSVAVLDTALLSDVFGVRAVVGTNVVTGTVSVTPVMRNETLAASGGFCVLVVSGAGTGAALMRMLVEAGFTVFAAALNRGDTDQAVAQALALERVDLPPFGSVDQLAEKRVRAIAEMADAVVVSRTPFGEANLGNLRAALGADKPVVVVESDEERDFCRGEARRYLTRALARDGVEVRSDEHVVPALRKVLQR
jgi:iron complex transport system ATP-binding protein